jgi:hypothetical protein
MATRLRNSLGSSSAAKFHGQEVLPTLRDYLDHTEQLIDEAERLMDPQVTS